MWKEFDFSGSSDEEGNYYITFSYKDVKMFEHDVVTGRRFRFSDGVSGEPIAKLLKMYYQQNSIDGEARVRFDIKYSAMREIADCLEILGLVLEEIDKDTYLLKPKANHEEDRNRQSSPARRQSSAIGTE